MENENIGLHTLSLKNYKRMYLQTLTINSIAVIGSYVLVLNGFYILPFFDPGKKFTWPIIIIMFIASSIYSSYHKKLLKKLDTFEDFDTKLAHYEKVYKFRVLWHLVACIVSCFLFVLTARYLFLYYAFFDLLVTLLVFPNKVIFRKELKNEEIVFV